VPAQHEGTGNRIISTAMRPSSPWPRAADKRVPGREKKKASRDRNLKTRILCRRRRRRRRRRGRRRGSGRNCPGSYARVRARTCARVMRRVVIAIRANARKPPISNTLPRSRGPALSLSPSPFPLPPLSLSLSLSLSISLYLSRALASLSSFE